ncbi:MAG: hypothetical protein JJU34_09235 [Lunatimonas sp.]|uniref:hypothetical protein n=1 Tax=Lunatimonas sp. TaxID=2060141 RepID=UPI00263B9C99|nr:hypothetical protein [Lunatimonas sp.]MCC5937453.1 hypothetical protein [Lunatimonas sp.]
MNSLSLLLILCAISYSCGQANYDPSQLTEGERDELMYRMVRYYGKLPKRHADHDNKFEERFSVYYAQHAKEHRVLAYHVDKEGVEHLLISREAPSLFKKFVATGIRFQRNEEDSLTYYEEVFRTWKMPEESLQAKAMMLFAKMVNGEDLSPYYPENSGEEEYIEFPDRRNAFDPSTRRWLAPSLVAK